MRDVINDAEAGVLFVGADFVGDIEDVRDQLRAVTTIVVLGSQPRHESYPDGCCGSPRSVPVWSRPAMTSRCRSNTSGTTGVPKGAMITNTNLGIDGRGRS